MLEQTKHILASWFGQLGPMAYGERLGTLGWCSPERLTERGDLIRAFRTLKRLAEVICQRVARFKIRRNETLRTNEKTDVRARATMGLTSNSFVIHVVDGCNRPPEEVLVVGSVPELKR